jgi:Sap, sulfolipid-1-addressing protein
VGLLIPVLLLGLLASLSPSTIVVFILLLATTRARVNAAAFLIGWFVSLVIVFAACYALGGARASQHGSGHLAVEAVEIVLGVALIALAVHQWQRRNIPRTGSGVTKRLTGRLKQLNPWEAAIVGVLEQPWTLTAAAAVVLIRHHSAALIALVAFLVFTIVSTATVGVILLYYSRRPEEAEARLSSLGDRVADAGPAIFAIVSLLVGAFLAIDGILGILGV